ncbi:MAG: NAD-dependent epimerase/dehydratase family protein [Flavobacteriaceae bacterium]|nr:NAD-dependent epimerase/dehydratase family protein [Flavobacteriaceae bacterium]
MNQKILIIGSSGQIGTELVLKLRQIYGNENVIASDIRKGNYEVMESGPFELLDVTKKEDILDVVDKYKIKQVYLMAAMLSAIAEINPKKAWDLNMDSLFNVLNLAKDKIIDKVFWPSSIAVFGPDTPRIKTPQNTIIKPSTVYGISKLAGENWCSYYHNKYGVDVRSVRYPGIISYKTTPGGGTTDYAVEIFYEAIKRKSYTSFLSENTNLPMMYMDDAISATIRLMQSDKIENYTSYNIAAMSFSPKELAVAIQKYMPQFTINYKLDSRQGIADSWPESIDDSTALKDWNWQSKVDLDELVRSMLQGLHYTI